MGRVTWVMALVRTEDEEPYVSYRVVFFAIHLSNWGLTGLSIVKRWG